MIKITDLAGRDKYINADLIERIESNHDTMVFLVNGHSLILKDKPEEIVEKVVQFKKRCLEGPPVLERKIEGDPPETQMTEQTGKA